MGQASAGAGSAAAEVPYVERVARVFQDIEKADPSGEGLAEFSRLLQREFRPPVPFEDGAFKVKDMDQLWRLARAVHASGIVPAGIKSVEALFVCLSCGLEAGLTVTQSLRGVMVVNNVPSVWGDMAVALVRASGKCRYIREWEEEVEGQGLTAYCESHREGEPDPVRRHWSEADTKTARLDEKPIHKLYPARMRKARARAFLIRDLYADVLGGLAIKEEMDDAIDPGDHGRGGGGGGGGNGGPSPEDQALAEKVRAKRAEEERAAEDAKTRAAEHRLDSLLNPGKKGEGEPEKPAAEAEAPAPANGKSKGDAAAEPPPGALEGDRKPRGRGKAAGQAGLLDPG